MWGCWSGVMTRSSFQKFSRRCGTNDMYYMRDQGVRGREDVRLILNLCGSQTGTYLV